jgi:hypothetical protein
MTAIFGIWSERHAIHSQVTKHYRSIWGQLNTQREESWLVGAHADPPGAELRRSGNLILAVDGEPTAPVRLQGIDTSGLTPGMLARSTGGNCFILDTNTGIIRLECHESGSLPLYWAVGQGHFIFGSSLRSFLGLGWDSIDFVGATSFLRHGYCLNDSTVVQGVNRLQPGQVLIWDPRSKGAGPRLEDRSRLWAHPQDPTEQVVVTGELTQYFWDLLRQAVTGAASKADSVGVMLSGGWDSRTLLAAFMDCSIRPVCYVHGDIESRELGLVRRLADEAGLDLISQPIDDSCLDPDWLLKRFARTENLVFPHWHRASEVLAARGITDIATGVFGEVLGGHYGPSMHLTGAAKIASVARELLFHNRNGKAHINEVELASLADLLEPSFDELPYYLKRDQWECASEIRCELSRATRAALTRYHTRGASTAAGLVEAFSTEHRGGQYISAQPLSFRASGAGLQPFAESELLMAASNLPLGTKVHNRLNRKILLAFSRPLTKYPMAATLVPASSPIAIQESSRLARRLWATARERISAELPFARPSNWRLSWVNFDFLMSSSSVYDLIEDLRQPFWNRDALLAKAQSMGEATEAVRPHHLYDQLMKIYKVDCLLR